MMTTVIPSRFVETFSASARRFRFWASSCARCVSKYAMLSLLARSAFFCGSR
jgi:hypothetical protein